MDTTQPESGFGTINPAANAPVGPTAWQLSEQRLARERAAGTGDYVRSIWRQDGLADGFVADLAGREMTPQPGYFAGSDPQWKELEDGLWDEHKKALYGAVSPAHALFLKDRLLQKQDDLTRLGDMGMAGNVGRFAMGVLSPDAILMGMAGGWVSRGVTAAKAYRLSKVAQAAEAAAAVANAGKGSAIAAGIGAGIVENAAYEKLRQNVNFEDDSTAVLENGLLGGLFTAPFAYAGARQARAVAKASEKEATVLKTLAKHEAGEELTPADLRVLDETLSIHEAIRAHEAGTIDADTLQARLDEFHGPVEPDDVWAARHGDRLRRETDAFIAENFPNAGKPVPALPKAEPSEMPASHAEVAAANRANPVLEGPMTGAMKATMAKRAELRKAFDLEDLAASTDATKRAERRKAFEEAERAHEAARKAEEERAYTQRELASAAPEEDPFVVAHDAASQNTPAEAPAGPVEAPAAAPEPVVAEAPRGADWTGREVSWLDPKTDSYVEGVVERFNPEFQKLVVKTREGYKNVSPRDTDQWDGHAPAGFIHSGSIGAAQVQKIAHIANQRTALAQARMDYFAILNGSENEGVRKLAFALMKDAIQVDKSDAQGWTASEHKKQLQRQVGGVFHVKVDEAFVGAVQAAGVGILQRGEYKTQFMEWVSRATRQDPSVQAEAGPAFAAVSKAATAMKDAYARMLKEADQARVKGVAGLQPNDLYVNRMWHHQNIREAMIKHGEDRVYELVANAIRVPGYTGDLAKAKRFLQTVMRLEFSSGLREVHLAGRDMGTLRTELAGRGMSPQDIDALVDVMFDVRAASGGDAGNTGNLKFRFDLDETHSTQTPAGTLRLQDLFENDARVVMDTYINSMGGHIGLARVGIDSMATWQARLKLIEDEHLANPTRDGARLAKELEYLRQVHSMIVGRPFNNDAFSNTARFLAAMRGYTRAATLGQLGLTAAFEMNRAVSMVGFRAMWQSMPSLREFVTALRQGHLPNSKLAQDILDMTGFGTEMASSYSRVHELESGFVGGTISRFEKGANKLSHLTDVISGNASFTSITRQMTAMGATRQAFEYAMKRKTLNAKTRERWVAQGLDDAEIDIVLQHLKDHAKLDPNGQLEGIRYEDWARDEPETYSKFQLFLSRQTRDAIQDHDVGETMPFMHSTAGKIIAELKTFMLVAHAKNFLKAAHFRDATAVQMWAVSMVAEAMAYSMQAAVNFPESLDEKLDPMAIAKGAFARSSANGLLPMLAEAGHVMLTGGDSLFQEGSTANTDNRAPWKTPSFMVATRLFNAVPDIVGAGLGTGNVTQSEFKDFWRAMPLSRLYGLPALGNYFAETFPKSGPKGDD